MVPPDNSLGRGSAYTESHPSRCALAVCLEHDEKISIKTDFDNHLLLVLTLATRAPGAYVFGEALGRAVSQCFAAIGNRESYGADAFIIAPLVPCQGTQILLKSTQVTSQTSKTC